MALIVGGRTTLYPLVIGTTMIVTGSINTLAAKWADRLEFRGVKFDHPFFQALCMFVGELLCFPAFLVFYNIRKAIRSCRRRRRAFEDGDDAEDEESEGLGFEKFNPFIFLPATMCDMVATSVMYLGLTLTNAASFQMLRGSVVVFTGLLSMAFLRAVLRGYKWLGIVGIVLGLVIVGLSDILFGGAHHSDLNSALVGDLLIVVAQVFVAVQMVYEQKFVLKYDVHPLIAVGWEGFFGTVILSVLLVPMYYINVPAMGEIKAHRLEDALAAFRELSGNPMIAVALIGTITSIAFFNFAGISVTKELSATTRMVLDSVRTLVIWAVSLGLHWQTFVPFQIIGFVLLILGMFVYNDLVFGPVIRDQIVSRLDQTRLRRCCLSFWGAGLDDEPPSSDRRGLADEQEEEEANYDDDDFLSAPVPPSPAL